MIERLLPLLIVIAAVAAFGLWHRRRNGAATQTTATFSTDDLRALGAAAGGTTMILFTAPSCAPCVPAKRILDDVAARYSVALVSADVAEHHAIASSQHVYRAPTTFVVDDRGRALARISGVPRPEELERVFAQAKVLAT